MMLSWMKSRPRLPKATPKQTVISEGRQDFLRKAKRKNLHVELLFHHGPENDEGENCRKFRKIKNVSSLFFIRKDTQY
jgi:hypothetical protein